MRSIASILSIYVLFLTVAPALPLMFASQEAHCGMSCCAAKESAEKSSPFSKQKNCKDACNPFMRCCNCHAMIKQPQMLSAPVTYLDRAFTSLKQTPGSAFQSDSWHPPKIA